MTAHERTLPLQPTVQFLSRSGTPPPANMPRSLLPTLICFLLAVAPSPETAAASTSPAAGSATSAGAPATRVAPAASALPSNEATASKPTLRGPPLTEAFPALSTDDTAVLEAEQPKYDLLDSARAHARARNTEAALQEVIDLVRQAPDFGPGIDLWVESRTWTDDPATRSAPATHFAQRAHSHPDDWTGWYGLAKTAVAEKAWEEALDAARKASTKECPYSGCYSALALAYSKLDRLEEGAAVFLAEAEAAQEDPLRAGLVMLGLAELLASQPARTQEAEEAFTDALDMLRPGRGWERAAGQLGRLYFARGQRLDALSWHRRALSVYACLGDDYGTGDALGRVGSAMSSTGSQQEAIPFLEASLEIMEKIGDSAEISAAENRLGATYHVMGRLATAVSWYERALEHLENTGNWKREGTISGNLATAYQSMGETRRAVELFRRTVASLDRPGAEAQLAPVLGNLGNALRQIGEIGEATRLHRRALEAYQAVNDRRGEGVVLTQLGLDYSAVGACRQAVQYLEPALAIHREVGNRWFEGMSLGTLSDAYFNLGHYVRARTSREESLLLFRAVGARVAEGVTLGNLAGLADSQGDDQKALALRNEALEILKQVGALHYFGGYLLFQADTYNRLGQHEKAIRLLQEGLELATRNRHTWLEGMVCQGLGKVWLDAGDEDAAMTWYTRLLEVGQRLGARDLENNALTNLAYLDALRGETERATARLDEVLARLDLLLNDMNDVELEAGTFKILEAPFALAVALMTGTVSRRHEASAPLEVDVSPKTLAAAFDLSETARAFALHRRMARSGETYYSDAPIELVNAWRIARHRLAQARGFLLSPGPSTAIEHALNELLEPLPAPQTPENSPRAVHSASLTPQQRLSLLHSVLKDRERVYLDAEQTLRDASPTYRRWIGPPSAALTEIQRTLPSRTAMIAFLVGIQDSFAWLITPERIRLFRLPARADLAAHVDRFREKITNPVTTYSEVATPAHALYRFVLEPIIRQVPAGTRLIIVPDGPLTAIPFEALVRRPPQPEDPSPAYLTLEHPVAYALSATTWLHGALRNRIIINGPMLAVTDPIYPMDPCAASRNSRISDGPGSAPVLKNPATAPYWTRLCYAETEASSISAARGRMRPSSRDDVMLHREAANEEALRALRLDQFAILHFATHGASYERAPGSSCLVLSQGHRIDGPDASYPGLEDDDPRSGGRDSDGAGTQRPRPSAGDKPLHWLGSTHAGIDFEDEMAPGILDSPHDGYLSVPEIETLPLNADLVVLSACGSAQGPWQRGEGVLSLSRAFLLAGARQVIASLWQVPDRSTAKFMGELYRELERHPPDEALNIVQRAFIAGEIRPDNSRADRGRAPTPTRHPYFWAAFTLTTGSSAPLP